LFVNVNLSSRYGNVSERILVENEPPVDVPQNFSATPAPSVPTLPGKATVKVAFPPAATVPHVCGIGVPEVVPNVAPVRTTLVKGAVPVLVTVTIKR
jgi:hypothetical protein